MTVLFIVLLHAVPVFVIAVWTESKFALIVAAIVAGIIGVATGNPTYIFADLIGVAIAFALGISFINFINDQKPSPAPQIERPAPAPAPAPEKKDEDSSWISGIVVFVIVAAIFYNKVTDKPGASPPPAQVQQQTFVPPKPAQTSRTERPVETRKQGAVNSNSGSSDLRHCLNLPTDAAIMRCANQGK
jgi:hypothetical protein